MIKHPLIYLLFIISVFLPKTASAQFNSWQTLFSPQLTTCLSGNDSHLFIGTQSGLIIYDLQKEEPLFLARENGLSSSGISALALDKDAGKLFIGYENGDLQIMELESQTFETISDIRISSLYATKAINDVKVANGKLWIATSFGLVVYDLVRSRFEVDVSRFLTFDEPDAQSTLILNDTLYVATDQGLFSTPLSTPNLKNPDAWTRTLPAGNNVPLTWLGSVDGQLLAGTSTGLFALTGMSFVDIPELNGTAIIDGSSGSIANLLSVGNSSANWVQVNASLAVEFMASVPIPNGFFQLNGTQWITTASSGAFRVSSTEVVPLSISGIANNNFTELTFYGNGFVGSAGRGNRSSTYFDGQTYYSITREGFPQVETFEQMDAEFANGRPVIGTWGSGVIEWINPDSIFIHTPSNSGLSGIANDLDYAVIPDVDVDAQGNIWMTNYSAADEKPLKVKRPNRGWDDLDAYAYPAPNPGYIYRNHWLDAQGNHWIEVLTNSGAPDVGLLVFDDRGTPGTTTDDRYRLLTTTGGSGNLPSTQINDIAFDQNGAAWIATAGGLVVVYNAFFLLSQSGSVNAVSVPVLEGEVVASIEIDITGQKWLATRRGIIILEAEVDRIKATLTSSNSGLADDDVANLDYNPKTGHIYAMTRYGISILESDRVQPKASPAEPDIYPNPFQPAIHNRVWISGMSENSDCLIMAIDGRVVRILQPTGSAVTQWDGRDENGQLVGSGVYFILIRDVEGDSSSAGKISVIR